LGLGIVEASLRKKLESYISTEASVFGLGYDTHPSAAEFLQYPIM